MLIFTEIGLGQGESTLKVRSQELSVLVEDSSVADVGDDTKHKIQFLSEQMSLLSVEPSGRRYEPETVRGALDLFLRSRNCYSATRNRNSSKSENVEKLFWGVRVEW